MIIVNDGSSDGTEELFPEFETQGIVCITQKNQGASTARNTGLSIAKGEYIQFLDADDIIHPTKIEKQVAQMKRENGDLSFTFWGEFSDDVNNSSDLWNSPWWLRINLSEINNGKDVMRSIGKNGWHIVTTAWLIKKELIAKAGYWNPNIGNNDDGEYFSRVLFWSNKVSIVREKLTYYHKSESEITLSTIDTEQKAYSALVSWKLIHALMLSANDKTLLAYPKFFFYACHHVTRKQFPAIAKLFAEEFYKIDVPIFLNKGKLNWLIELFGLHYGNKIFYFLNWLKKRIK